MYGTRFQHWGEDQRPRGCRRAQCFQCVECTVRGWRATENGTRRWCPRKRETIHGRPTMDLACSKFGTEEEENRERNKVSHHCNTEDKYTPHTTHTPHTPHTHTTHGHGQQSIIVVHNVPTPNDLSKNILQIFPWNFGRCVFHVICQTNRPVS